MKDLSGETISHYRIIEAVGRGGMGVVYKAEDARLKRTVALKFLPPDLTHDPDARLRFVHEATAASTLQHNNICVVYDIDETAEGQIFISMEHLDGETLKKRIERGPLRIEEAIDITTQVAQGLMKAHEHGIVHRDIKPANIIITSDGVAKIVDFGLAKLSGQTMLTKSGSTLGTAAYMSPEQARGDAVDYHTDIWSIGIILYEMLTGKKPFDAEYDNALVYSVLNEDPKPVTGLRTGVPIELERIISKCLMKSPKDRYQHIDELLVDVRRVNLLASKAVRPWNEEKAQRRSRQRTVALASVTILLVGGVVVTWLLLKGYLGKSAVDRSSISLAVLPFPTLSADEDARMFADGVHGEILNHLIKIKALRVKGQTSVLQYRDTHKRLREVGEELGVDYLIEGSVHRAGDRIRVQAQLIDAKSEDHVWAETYDRPFRDIFDVESSISQKIASELNAVLSPREKRLLEEKATENLEAYECYLKGLYYFNVPTGVTGNDKASEMFEKATTLDPNFALAHAMLSIVENTQATYTSRPRPDRVAKARRALQRAISLNPDLPETHVARAYSAWFIERDSAGTWRELETTMLDQPHNSTLLFLSGGFLMNQGADEQARDLFLRAIELDPMNTNCLAYLTSAERNMRMFTTAGQWANTLVSQAPSEWSSYRDKFDLAVEGWGDLEKGRNVLDEALEATTERSDSWVAYMNFHIAFYQRDYREALRILNSGHRFSVPRYLSQLQRAQLYELLGSHTEAQKYLDSALVQAQGWWDLEPLWAARAVVYALQGNRRAALREMERAQHPGAKLWNWGRMVEWRIADAWIALGDHERAIDQLEYLLTVPSLVTKSILRLDPMYDPLRANPRFKALMEKTEPM